MKYAGLGGAPVPAVVTERLEAHGITVFRSYGSTEQPSITGSLYAPRPASGSTPTAMSCPAWRSG
jgi:acyl-CoA synthetase